jgi:hypothetical protein
MFDMGAFPLNSKDILLYGGFKDGPVDSTWIYRTDSGAEGSFIQPSEYKLAEKDFFVVNGVQMNVPNSNSQKVIFSGHSHLHCLNMETKTFETLAKQ